MSGLLRKPRAAAVAGVVLVAIGVVAPFLLAPFYVFLLSMLFSYAVALVGLNLLTGHSGQISLGHGAFYAAGAYGAAIVVQRVDGDWAYLVALPVAMVVCFAFGYGFGIPAVRLHGLSLALGTLALAVAVPPLLKKFESVTGGSVGLSAPAPQPPAGTGLAQDQWVYLLALALLVIGLVISRNLVRGRFGRALNAVRDNEIAAKAMGVDLIHYKTMAFALAATYGGVGGVVYAWTTAYVSPGTFGLILSIYLLAGLIVGGVGTGLGPFIGAAFIYFVPSTVGRINDAAPGVFFGVVLIAVILLFPRGIGGLVDKLLSRRQVAGPGVASEPDPRLETVT